MIRAILQRALKGLEALLPVDGAFDTTRLSAAQRARFFALYDAGRVRLDGATALRESGKSIPALLLYRDAFSMLARAHAVASEAAGDAVELDAATALQQFISYLSGKYATAARALRDDLATTAETTTLDALGPRELDARVAELAAIAPDVLSLMTPVTSEQQKRTLFVRRAVVAVGLLGSLAAIVATLISPENIALHKPATSATTAFDTRPSGAVNGRIYEQYGFHSDTQESPWLRIDLERTYDITRIRVHGRHDCCLGQSMPMVVELSFDGEKFHKIASRSAPFDQLDPWEINLEEPARGRYLRIRSRKKTVLVLTEVEAYGKPSR